jgi:hypothetical protein
MRIDVAIDQLQGLISYFEKYRENGFTSALITAKEIATEMKIDPIFHKKRQLRRKKQFDENDNTEIEQSPEESFIVNYFIYIVDQALSFLKNRFEQFQIYENIFGFLFDMKKLTSLDDNLKKYCVDFEGFLKHDNFFDLDGNDLFSELKVLQEILPKEKRTATDIINFIKDLNCFPNACIAYRILLTIPVTVAPTERSFSKLKLLKSYLRSIMSQKKLNGLTILSIEQDFLENIKYTSLISNFAAQTVRRDILQCFIYIYI